MFAVLFAVPSDRLKYVAVSNDDDVHNDQFLFWRVVIREALGDGMAPE